MKELLRKLYKYIEPKLFDETFAQVDAERIELKLKVEELEDELSDARCYGSHRGFCYNEPDELD